jgi:hypothetical protein
LPNEVLYFTINTSNTPNLASFFAGTLDGYSFLGSTFWDITNSWNPTTGSKFSTVNSGVYIAKLPYRTVPIAFGSAIMYKKDDNVVQAGCQLIFSPAAIREAICLLKLDVVGTAT